MSNAIVVSALQKLRTMFDNAMVSAESHIPSFTGDEIEVVVNDLAPKLGLPTVWVQVAQQDGMKIAKIVDPQEVAFLGNVKTLIDHALEEVGAPLTPVDPTAGSGTMTLGVTTSPEEKQAVAEKVEDISPVSPEPVNAGLTPEQHAASGPIVSPLDSPPTKVVPAPEGGTVLEDREAQNAEGDDAIKEEPIL
jgi:hypothetical protein